MCDLQRIQLFLLVLDKLKSSLDMQVLNVCGYSRFDTICSILLHPVGYLRPLQLCMYTVCCWVGCACCVEVSLRALYLLLSGKEAEVVTVHPRTMFIPQEGWTFLAAGESTNRWQVLHIVASWWLNDIGVQIQITYHLSLSHLSSQSLLCTM